MKIAVLDDYQGVALKMADWSAVARRAQIDVYTELAEASRAAGCTLAGFTTQSFFLAGLGIDHEMQTMAAGDANQFARLANEARQLMLPGEMGERFKAMLWLRGLELPLAGFALQDLRHTL